MGVHQFKSGKQIVWHETVFLITRMLPNNQVNLENIVTGAVIIVDLSDLTKSLYDGDLSFVETNSIRGKAATEHKVVDLADCPPEAVEIARFRLDVIQPLLGMEERTKQNILERVENIRIYTQKQQLNKSHYLKTVSYSSIYRWIKAYESSGRDIRSLLPAFDRRGGRNNPRIKLEINNIVKSAIDDIYLNRERKTVDDVHHEVAARIEDNNRFCSPADKLKLPSRSTITRRVEQMDMVEVFAARYGKRAVKRQYTQYGKGPEPLFPLDVVEIDHTPIDLIVVDENDCLPLGRATLTDSLDICTRYPLGFYLGFEPPSFYTVIECLYHAITPKGNVLQKYDVKHSWQAYGIPQMLKTDNGPEFIGNSLADACQSLGIILEQNPIREPHYKGKIERFFRSQTFVIHGLSGTTFSNPIQRGDYDSVGQACIFLNEMEAILYNYFLDIYAESKNRGINAIPARRWERFLNDGFEPRHPQNAQELLILLGQVEYRTIHHYGIDLFSLRYNCSDLALVRNRAKGDKVKIKYHPGDLSTIYVMDPGDHTLINVPVLEHFQEYTKNGIIFSPG